MKPFAIQEINGPHDENFIDEFVKLHHKVREPKYNIGGPGELQLRGLIPWGLEHGANFWMIQNNTGQTIARLCARVSPHIKQHGTIGLFEIDLSSPDLVKAFEVILNCAVEWLKKFNVTEIAGPIDMSTWFTYRFSVQNKKFWPRFKWEPTTPNEYLSLFKSFGFNEIAFYHSVYFPYFRIGKFCLGTAAMKKSHKHLTNLGFKLRPFDFNNFMTHEVPLCHEISHEAFQGSFLFEPINLTTFSSLYAGALKSYDFSPSCVLIAPDGETAGFIFAFYDDDYLVVKSLALKKKFQGMNLSSGMVYSSVSKSFQDNKKGTISALVKSGLASESIENNVKKTLWFTWSHNYVLLNRKI